MQIAVTGMSSPAGVTNWTGIAGNNFWSDPANWSAGVPDATSDVTFSAGSGTIDLAGATRQAQTLNLNSPSFTFVSGGFDVQQLSASNTNFVQTIHLGVPVTNTTSSVLEIDTKLSSSKLFVDGPVIGSGFDLQANAIFTGASSYSGNTLVPHYDTMQLYQNGSTSNSPQFDVAGALMLNNQSGNLPDRINDAAHLILHGGALLLQGNSAAATSERIGAVDLAADDNTLAASSVSQPVTLTIGQLTRQPQAIGYIGTSPQTQNRILLGTVPAMIGDGASPTSLGVIPWLRGGMVTYDRGPDLNNPADDRGLRILTDQEYASMLPASPGGPAENVLLSSPQTMSTSKTANSLSLATNITLTLQNAAAIQIDSGALALNDGKIVGDGAITTSGELIVSGGGTLGVPVSAQSLTLSGGVYVLNAPNNVPGGIVVDALNLGTPAALGTGPLRIRGMGARHVFNGGSYTIPNDVTFGYAGDELVPSSGLPLNDAAYVRLTGNTVTLTGQLRVIDGGVAVYGSGTLRIDGGGTFGAAFLTSSSAARIEVNSTLDTTVADPAKHDLALQIGGNVGGNGVIHGSLVDATASAGAAGQPGRLTANRWENEGGATLLAELFGLNAGIDYDQLVVLNSIVLIANGDVGRLDVTMGFFPGAGDSFEILDYRGVGAIPGFFEGLPEGATFVAGSTPLRISYAGGDGNDVVLTVVPEPAGIALLIAGGALARRARRLV